MKRIVVWNPTASNEPEDEVFSVYCTVVDMFHHAPDDKQVQFWHTLAEFAKDHPRDAELVARVRKLLPAQFKEASDDDA